METFKNEFHTERQDDNANMVEWIAKFDEMTENGENKPTDVGFHECQVDDYKHFSTI